RENTAGIAAAVLGLSLDVVLAFDEAFPVASAVLPRMRTVSFCANIGAAVTIRRHDLVGLEQKTGIGSVETIDVAQRNATHRIAMVSTLQREKPRPPPATAAGEFVSQLERDFHGRGAVITEKDFRQTGI